MLITKMVFRFFGFLILGLALASPAMSQEPAQEPRTLKLVMSEMGPIFKNLSRQISDPNLNGNSIQLTQKIQVLIGEASNLTPTTVIALPVQEQRGAYLVYQKMMLQLRVAAIDLEQALTANNQSGATMALKQMADLRGAGHSQFIEQ